MHTYEVKPDGSREFALMNLHNHCIGRNGYELGKVELPRGRVIRATIGYTVPSGKGNADDVKRMLARVVLGDATRKDEVRVVSAVAAT